MVERQLPKQGTMNGLAVVSSPISPSPEPKWATSVKEGGNDSSKKIQYDDNMVPMDRILLCLAEFGGTGILVFLGCLGCASKGAPQTMVQVAFSFGFAILIALQAFGHISGGHINPAVTIAALMMGMIPLIQVPIYLLGQFVGALAGYGLIKAVVPSEYTNKNNSASLCSPDPNEALTELQVVMLEFLMTLFLVWTICSMWDSRNANKTETVPLKLGLVIAGLAFAGGGFTGAHMNPARTFGPAVINGDWKHHWMYWIGPLVAGAVGGLSYRIIFLRNVQSNEAVHEMSEKP